MEHGANGIRGVIAASRVAWAGNFVTTHVHTLLIVMEENVKVQGRRKTAATHPAVSCDDTFQNLLVVEISFAWFSFQSLTFNSPQQLQIQTMKIRQQLLLVSQSAFQFSFF